MNIPLTVAIFDDTIVDRNDPAVLNRYAVVRLMEAGDAYTFFPISDSVTSQKLMITYTGIEERIIAKLPMKSLNQLLLRKTTLWETGWMADFGGESIPVIDIQHRTLLNGLPYVIRKYGDTLQDCRDRQTAQRTLHLKVFSSCILGALQAPVAPAPPAPPAPHPPAESRVPQPCAPIPGFVARLIKAEAIRKKESCPISTIPFEEGMEICMTPCFHLFEADAIQRWMRIKENCPVCKQDVAELVAV